MDASRLTQALSCLRAHPRASTVLYACLLMFTCAAEARAYCRETTKPAADGCSCSLDGEPFYWPDQNIVYAFNDRGFPGVSEAALRPVFARSFAHWSDLVCEDGPVALSPRAESESTSSRNESQANGPNTNVILHLSEADFLAADGSEFAFALTHLTYRNTGEIIDADILFNAGRGPFTICPESGCPGGAVDLENVATHEIGHLLGLAHSEDDEATMACSAEVGDLGMRSLELDDIEGICEIYGPAAIEERAAALTQRRVPAGCACRAGGPTGHGPSALTISLALLALFITRRRMTKQIGR
jgi:hypothetical protein